MQRELLGHFIAQQPAEPRADVRELLRAARRDRLPAEKVFEQREQSRRRREQLAGRLDVARETDHGFDQLAILPKAEFVAIRVEQIRQRAEFFPLRLVVRILEFTRVRALSGSLEFDVAGERAMHRDRVVRPRLQLTDRGLADADDIGARDLHQLREIAEQMLEWRAQLLLRLAGRRGVGELGFRRESECGNRQRERAVHRRSSAIFPRKNPAPKTAGAITSYACVMRRRVAETGRARQARMRCANAGRGKMVASPWAIIHLIATPFPYEI